MTHTSLTASLHVALINAEHDPTRVRATTRRVRVLQRVASPREARRRSHRTAYARREADPAYCAQLAKWQRLTPRRARVRLGRKLHPRSPVAMLEGWALPHVLPKPERAGRLVQHECVEGYGRCDRPRTSCALAAERRREPRVQPAAHRVGLLESEQCAATKSEPAEAIARDKAERNRPLDTHNRVVLPSRPAAVGIVRDPRWGRNLETPSEDPTVCGSFGVAVTQGLQASPLDSRYVQAVVTLKHFDANSLEGDWGPDGSLNRHTVDSKISAHDLAATYLPAFKRSVEEGGALGVMCSYNVRPPPPAVARRSRSLRASQLLATKPCHEALPRSPATKPFRRMAGRRG